MMKRLLFGVFILIGIIANAATWSGDWDDLGYYKKQGNLTDDSFVVTSTENITKQLQNSYNDMRTAETAIDNIGDIATTNKKDLVAIKDWKSNLADPYLSFFKDMYNQYFLRYGTDGEPAIIYKDFLTKDTNVYDMKYDDPDNTTPMSSVKTLKGKIDRLAEYTRDYTDERIVIFNETYTKPAIGEVSSKVDGVNTTATNALDKAETAQTTANSANTKADSLRTDLGTVGTVATNALNKANAAQNTANTANNTATTANTNATQAKTTANTAMNNVTQVLQILEGDDFRITVTNYDSTVNAPMSSYDAKYTDGSTSIWKTVWVETNRHEITKREVLNVVSNKYTSKTEANALRKWGNFDSVTGQAAPEGFAQCSNDGGMIFGNGAGYKSYATGSGSSYWIWQQNSGFARIETNGVFRILDADGKEAFSVTKGDKKILGADASGFYCGKLEFQATWIEIHYSVDSATHPTIEYSDTLENGGVWYKEGDSDFPLTILWTRNDTLNYWSAYLTDPRDNVQGFFRATYEAGADTVVSVGSTPMAMEYIYLGGKKYKLGTATINGNTVLTLTE